MKKPAAWYEKFKSPYYFRVHFSTPNLAFSMHCSSTDFSLRRVLLEKGRICHHTKKAPATQWLKTTQKVPFYSEPIDPLSSLYQQKSKLKYETLLMVFNH